MLSKLTYYNSENTDPYSNLALEEYLTFHTERAECLLFLWQNAHSVVIGRNQNCWRECRVSELEADGGKLVRRLSGGGAVYHDLGNLNFTFCLRKDNADTAKQLAVISEAVAYFGLDALVTGRNDLTLNGGKFSGNAFFSSQNFCYHHGTLLVDVAADALARFLKPAAAKLASKGVASVKARIVNLAALNPAITVSALRQAMLKAFAAVYQLTPEPLDLGRLDAAVIAAARARFAAPEWIYGRRIPFTNSFGTRFTWGDLQVLFNVNRGIIEEAAFYSDALAAEWFSGVGGELQGCQYAAPALCQRLQQALYKRQVPAEIQQEVTQFVRERI